MKTKTVDRTYHNQQIELLKYNELLTSSVLNDVITTDKETNNDKIYLNPTQKRIKLYQGIHNPKDLGNWLSQASGISSIEPTSLNEADIINVNIYGLKMDEDE